MTGIEFYFDGYCPESLLKGEQEEMKLNENDFWESETTGLQMSIFSPYAAILRWRGNGKFRVSSVLASDVLTGLIMAGTLQEDEKEIFPDLENIIHNKFDLAWYIDEIYKSKKEMDAEKFDYNDPALETQRQYLSSLTKSDFKIILDSYEQLAANGFENDCMHGAAFSQFHQSLYDLNLIFNFKWMAWHSGWKNLNDSSFDFSQSTLLDLSMYLTAICRADRFNEGTIEQHLKNGSIGKVVERLKMLAITLPGDPNPG